MMATGPTGRRVLSGRHVEGGVVVSFSGEKGPPASSAADPALAFARQLAAYGASAKLPLSSAKRGRPSWLPSRRRTAARQRRPAVIWRADLSFTVPVSDNLDSASRLAGGGSQAPRRRGCGMTRPLCGVVMAAGHHVWRHMTGWGETSAKQGSSCGAVPMVARMEIRGFPYAECGRTTLPELPPGGIVAEQSTTERTKRCADTECTCGCAGRWSWWH